MMDFLDYLTRGRVLGAQRLVKQLPTTQLVQQKTSQTILAFQFMQITLQLLKWVMQSKAVTTALRDLGPVAKSNDLVAS